MVHPDLDERRGRLRWAASTAAGGAPCNFSLVLGEDGAITFHYGPGNTGLTPTIGLSRGHSDGVLYAPGYDAAPTLTDAHSFRYSLSGSRMPPGLRLLPDGTITGRPTRVGQFEPLLRVTDADGHFDQRVLTVRVRNRFDRQPR